MKQIVNLNDLLTLNKQGIQNYKEYLFDRAYTYWNGVKRFKKPEHIPEKELPLPTIGMMLEYLTLYDSPIILVKSSEWHGGGWTISYMKEIPKKEADIKKCNAQITNNELINALWEIFKYRLELE